MPLDQREKELAAIGASIGSNCRPCIEHHIAAGREAGLSDGEVQDAVATAHAVRVQAVELLSARVSQLLGHGGVAHEPAGLAQASRGGELVALGASVGANSHSLLRLHIGAAIDMGLTPLQIRSALKMAEYVQQRAAELTAEAAAHALPVPAPAGLQITS
jgi:AhpD family alkylhydroperoxidase